jgi:biotin carboxyl carrier protein
MRVRSRRYQEPAPEAMGERGAFGFRLLVSPISGRLRHLPPADFRVGHEWVSAGQAVAVVEQGANAVEVRSPIEARVGRMLASDGEPVVQGQPLVWLEQDPSTAPRIARRNP